MHTHAQRIIAELMDANPEVVLFDNMDSAIVGLGYIADNAPVAVYSKAKIFAKLLTDGLSTEDALEYYIGKFVALRAGEFTPVIVDDLQEG